MLKPRSRSSAPLAVAALCVAPVLAGCAGGTDADPGARVFRVEDVGVPPGYAVELVAHGFVHPTCVTVDENDRVHVLEGGYAYGEDFTAARLVRVEPGGATVEVLALGAARPAGPGPWTGAVRVNAAWVLTDGKGRVLRFDDGAPEPVVLVEGLPGGGDHHTNQPVLGADGWIYFGQGTVTNSGVVGPDNAEMGWLQRTPDLCDVPGEDVVLVGSNFASADPRTAADDEDAVQTGAFVPFGTLVKQGQVVRGRTRCSGAVLRVHPRDGTLELVAWGLRNPFDLAFDAGGALLAVENGPDRRGSRPIYGAPDCLWRIERGRWYGWPDYYAGVAVTDPRFAELGEEQRFVLEHHPGRPPAPLARLGVHASSNGIALAPAGFGHAGQAFVAQFGDLAPMVGKVMGRVGFMVVRVDVRTGVVEPFLVNRGDENGPASELGGGGLERPIDLCFDRAGRSLYVLDFGVLGTDEGKPQVRRGSGALWRVMRDGEEP